MGSTETSVISAFIEHGALGLLCMMEAFAIVALWRQLQATNEARILEGKLVVQVAEQSRDAMDRLTDAINARGRLLP